MVSDEDLQNVYLLYCVFHSSGVQRQETLPGVGGQPIFSVAVNGISAAVSEISDADLAPDVPRIMAYQNIVASFHNDRTVIPMRFGCVFRGKSQVIQFLNKNARQHESLLKELDSCVEMGIRLMIDDGELPIGELKSREINPEISHSKLKLSGKAYLAGRKTHYAQEEHITDAKNEIAGQFRAALKGLFVKCKVETSPMLTPSQNLRTSLQSNTKTIPNPQSPIPNRQSTINNPLLSLYFLVPGKSIDPFRQVYRRMRRRMKTTKLLLSGPWPPYNFVLPDNEQLLGPSSPTKLEKNP